MVPATLLFTGVSELRGDAWAAKKPCRYVSPKQRGCPVEGPAGSPWASGCGPPGAGYVGTSEQHAHHPAHGAPVHGPLWWV